MTLRSGWGMSARQTLTGNILATGAVSGRRESEASRKPPPGDPYRLTGRYTGTSR